MEIEERKTKIKYKYDRYDKKSNQLRVNIGLAQIYAKQNHIIAYFKVQNLYGTKKSLLVCTFLSFIVIWLVYSLIFSDSESESPDDELCHGYSIKNKLVNLQRNFYDFCKIYRLICIRLVQKIRGLSDNWSIMRRSLPNGRTQLAQLCQ